MIQIGTRLKVLDNSGAKIVGCIHIITHYKSKYAKIGDLILVSIKKVRSKRRDPVKIAKGKIFKALIVHTRLFKKGNLLSNTSYFSNACILLTKQNKLVATRILCAVSRNFRYTKFLKILILTMGVI